MVGPREHMAKAPGLRPLPRTFKSSTTATRYSLCALGGLP